VGGLHQLGVAVPVAEPQVGRNGRHQEQVLGAQVAVEVLAVGHHGQDVGAAEIADMVVL